MAEVIVAELVKILVEKLGSKFCESIVSARDIESKIKGLEDLKNIIEAAKLDADSVPLCTHTRQWLLDKLELGLAKIYDFQDAKATKAKQKENTGGSNKFRKEMQLFFPTSIPIVSSYKDAKKIKGITEGINIAVRNHDNFGSIVSSSSMNQTQTLSNVSESDHTIDRTMIGRDKDMDNIVSLLFDPSTAEENVSVASIVGMGGVGKTMLAKYVYNDNKIDTYFDLKLWVFATQDFNVKDVLRQMVTRDTREQVHDYTMEQLKRSLSQIIAGKRFLLVLDGVWDEVSLRVKWQELERELKDGAKGSRVLLTTRSDTVARIIGAHEPYMINDLSDDDCWLLFKDIAITTSHEQGVKAIGKEISKMCHKVPLAILTIGTILAGKFSVREWRTFRNDQLESFKSYGSNVLNTLKLSYDQLGEGLKLCVKYCSLFPKGFRFEKDRLIHLWIAMGYVKTEYTNQSLEDAAEDYMLCLLGRGFFYCMKTRDGTVWKNNFQMHNLMHDLVLSVTGVKYKMADSNTNEFDERVWHVSFVSVTQSPWKPPSSLFKIEYLNTFLLPLPSSGPRSLQKIKALPVRNKLILDSFRPLRVLRMHGVGITELPNSVGDLIHLRYLDLSFNYIRKLPRSITKLVNLYLLDLSYCRSLEELPEDIGKLKMLRHLDLQGCSSLSHMPNELQLLTGLETLNQFVVGKPRKSKAYSPCGLADLSRFVNLKGRLTIILAERSKDIISEAKAANLDNKKITHFHMGFKGSEIQDEMVLENLKPGDGLECLIISNYGGNRLPCWMREGIHSGLPYLVEVQIVNCQECIFMCSFGRLAHLKSLILNRLEKVEYIENGDSSSSSSSDNTLVLRDEHASTPLFPSLQYLSLTEIPALKGWWSVTDSAQDRGLNQLQKWMPAFPKLEEVRMDMELVISLAQVFLQRISSVRRLVVIGKIPIVNVRTKAKAIQKSLPSNVATRPRQPVILLKSYLPMLVELRFHRIKLVYLPEEFRGMPALEILGIYDCEALEAVPEWIDSLTSLRSLTIDKCPKIKSLPSEISNLSNLTSLILTSCSFQLAERCQEQSGEDWSKIKHIPNIRIEVANNVE
ncbi:disease resistance protein RGA2-like [Silene latifolia]|uniref:disease resistance protein RGA2-like n=1 Tax=Silene latifolia TaxID=37657 RepID=UPI003D7750F7